MKSIWLWLALALVVVGIDQCSKYAVMSGLELGEQWHVFSLLSFVHVHNDGAAFSFLSDASGWQRWAFSLLAVVFSVFLIFELRKLESRRLDIAALWLGGALALILGGANGNLVDRVVHGYVVDFILVHWREHYFAVFNLADSAIFLGAVLWIGHIFLVGEPPARDRSGTAAAADSRGAAQD